LNVFTFFRHVYLGHFSQPVADRALYRAIMKAPAASIVEVGVGSLARTKRLLALTAEKTSLPELKYAGIDLFESRPPEQPGISLKSAHKELKSLAGKVQLIPGDPFSALARAANSLLRTDIVIVCAIQDSASLTKAWFYVPRMLHDNSRVFVEEAGQKPGETKFRLLARLELERLASDAARSMRRAA
jgi:hypothetical protein